MIVLCRADDQILGSVGVHVDIAQDRAIAEGSSKAGNVEYKIGVVIPNDLGKVNRVPETKSIETKFTKNAFLTLTKRQTCSTGCRHPQ